MFREYWYNLPATNSFGPENQRLEDEVSFWEGQFFSGYVMEPLEDGFKMPRP